MVNLLFTEAYLSRVTNCGVSGALKSGADREGEFNQTAAAFVERPRIMALVSQLGEGYPHIGIELFEAFGCLGQFFRQATLLSS